MAAPVPPFDPGAWYVRLPGSYGLNIWLNGVRHLGAARVQSFNYLVPLFAVLSGALLLGEDAQPVRHQVTELPRVEPEVTEYRQHTLTCLACGTQTHAELPPEIPAGSFGPRLRRWSAI